ncbi:MAG: nuclear transport factor 2 family protein [Cyclobacteriaceae bacterium]|nr:nuclear transport factor 2 family protein [Cyclobacteriaceae bacterium]
MRAIIVFILSVSAFCTRAQQATDQEMVYTAIEDYVDGLYLVQPDRIKKSVHPNLTKKGFWRQPEKTAYEKESIMTFDQLVDLAGRWNAKGTLPKDAPRIIEVFDVLDQTATAKLTAQWGIDYFQLAKYEGKWLIVNIIWQAHPPKGS